MVLDAVSVPAVLVDHLRLRVGGAVVVGEGIRLVLAVRVPEHTLRHALRGGAGDVPLLPGVDVVGLHRAVGIVGTRAAVAHRGRVPRARPGKPCMGVPTRG